MLYLQAISISTCVKEKMLHCSKGKVSNVFSRAINMINEQEEVIGITEPEALNNPISLLVPQASVYLPRCFPGMKVFFSNKSLRIGRYFTIYFENASFFDPSLKLKAPISPYSLIQERLRYISRFSAYGRGGVGDLIPYYGLLSQGKLPEVRLSPWAEVLAPHLAGLCQSLALANRENERIFFHRIIGVGKGFTPAGDDVLIGLFGSLKVFLRESSVNDSGDKLLPQVSWIKGTTPLSSALIRHSLQGEIAEGLGNLVQSILAGEGTLDGNLRQLLSMGATSGEDTILGVLLGVNIGLRILG